MRFEPACAAMAGDPRLGHEGDGSSDEGGDLVGRRLPVVLHRQAAVRGGAGAVRAPGRRRGRVPQLRAQPWRGAGRGRQAEMKERLLAAYFTEGRAIGDREALVALAQEVGISPEAARDTLDSGAY